VSHYTYWEYEPHGPDQLHVWSAADNTTIPFDVVLERFLDTLAPTFWSAEPWEPQTARSSGRSVPASSPEGHAGSTS
jgi:hypothetical protein